MDGVSCLKLVMLVQVQVFVGWCILERVAVGLHC